MRIASLSGPLFIFAVGGFVAVEEARPEEKQPAAPAAAPPAAVPQTTSVDFLHDVMPVINRLGCNATKCHGADVWAAPDVPGLMHVGLRTESGGFPASWQASVELSPNLR